MEIFVVKSNILEGSVKKSGFEKYFQVRQYEADKETPLKNKKKKETTNIYKPKRVKSILKNILPEKMRSKSSDNQVSRCYFERIMFSSSLCISKVEKIFPSQYVDCIESLQMSEMRDIIVLRAR